MHSQLTAHVVDFHQAFGAHLQKTLLDPQRLLHQSQSFSVHSVIEIGKQKTFYVIKNKLITGR
jgi:hypothetical protein